MLLRFVGQGGRRRLEKDIAIPVEGMSDEFLVNAFFLLKREGMRRGLISRHGYRKRGMQESTRSLR